MCGRYVIAARHLKKIERELGVVLPLEPNLNIAPTLNVPVIRQSGGGYELRPMRWGLVPHWSREPSTKYSTFNARAETVSKKPAFRESFERRRAIFPASGFYEWSGVKGKKEPWYFSDAGGDGLALAGLWDVWRGADADGRELELYSATILVCPPNPLVAKVHDRMPVILAPGGYRRWLDPDLPGAEVEEPLAPYPADEMTLVKVDKPRLGEYDPGG